MDKKSRALDARNLVPIFLVMKRMYVTLAVIFLALLWAFTSLGQKTTVDSDFDRMKRRMELREEMHRRMINKLFYGTGTDDLFKDMEKMFEDEAGFQSFSVTPSYETEWQESSSGRTLLITPKNKDQQLDIDVTNDLITIKGKNEQKTLSGSSLSSFSNSFSVPEDCDGTKVKIDQKDGKILVFLPYKSVKSVPIQPKKGDRIPLPKTEDAVEI